MNKTSIRYKHFILTHFNLKLSEEGERCFVVDKNLHSTQNDNWMNERIRLFDKYSFPSIAAQTNKNFTWLVLFDENTPDKYKAIFEEYHQKCNNCVPVYMGPSGRENLYEKVSPILKSFLNQEEYIITTNIDNDDTFHEDIVENIQNEFLKEPKETLYRFVYGYQYFENMNFMMRMKYPHNHFLTLASLVTDEHIKPITHYGHTRAHKRLPHVDIITTPMWIEIVHGSNVNNSLRVKFKIKYKPVLANRNFDQHYHTDIQLKVGNNIMRSIFTLPWMVVKHLGKKIAKKF